MKINYEMGITQCSVRGYNVYTQAVSTHYFTQATNNPNEAGTLTISTQETGKERLGNDYSAQATKSKQSDSGVCTMCLNRAGSRKMQMALIYKGKLLQRKGHKWNLLISETSISAGAGEQQIVKDSS